MFFTLSLFLVAMLYSNVSDFGLAEESSLEHHLVDGKSDCFDECQKLRSSKAEVGTNCRQMCLNGRRRKRSIDDGQEKYYACKQTTERRLQDIGNITNTTVEFTLQRLQNGTTDGWIANLTWGVSYINSSLYSSNIWTGFEIHLVKGKETDADVYCRFHNKSARWTIIEGLGKLDLPLYVLVTFYPPSKSEVGMQQTMDIFIPKGVFTTKRSVSGTSEPNTRDRRFNSTKGIIFSTKHYVSGTAEPNTSDRVYYISGAVSGGVLVGIALLLAVYFHRRRSDSSGIYTPDPLNTKYDTSIIFSSKDEKFIVKKLLPFLEGEKHFKCCVHFRDWEPGEVVPTSMAKMVYNCKKVIAVISKHFLASNFCQEELNMALGRLAHQGDSSLIVINLDGVAVEELPPALQTRTFLDLTSSTEKKTWRTRLERQISAENSRIVYSDIFEDDNKRNSERLLEREETSSENTVGRLYISGGYSHINDCSTSSNSESSIAIQV